jgi:hypothetical protein
VVAAQNHPAPSVQTAAVAPLPEPPAITVATDAPAPPAIAVTTNVPAPLPKPPATTVAPPPPPPAITVATNAVAPLPMPPAITVATDAAAPLPNLHAITVASRQEWSAEPVGVPRPDARSRVWTHRRRAPVRRVYYQSYPAGPPVILARMVQNIQRDVGALFR